MPRVKEYYSKILEQVPDAPLFLLHTSERVAAVEEPPFAQTTGTDRYAFWFNFGHVSNRATPSYALNWFRSQVDLFYQHAKERGQAFEIVIPNDASERPFEEGKLWKSIYPESVTDNERDKVLSRWKQLAENENQGLRYGEDGRIIIWQYYRPPANCTLAMGWLAVMEGADAVSCYFWGSDLKVSSGRKEGRFSGALGWDGHGTAAAAEFAEFLDSVRPYGRLIRSMVKETDPSAKKEEVAQNPVFDLGDNKEVLWRSFAVPGYEGQVVVMVNTQVGEWSGHSPFRLKESDLFRLDQDGNVIDYKPYYAPRKVEANLLDSELVCYDPETKQVIETDENGRLQLYIRPGYGKVLFLAPKEGSEIDRLRQEFNL